jgi:hypothetical protein
MSYLSVSAQRGSPETWVKWSSNAKVMMSARLVFRLSNSVAVTLKPPLPGWPSGDGLIEATSNSAFVPSGSPLGAIGGGGSSQCGFSGGALQRQWQRIRPLIQCAGDRVSISFDPALVVHAVPWDDDLHGVPLERDGPEVELTPVRKVMESSLIGVPVLVDLEGKPDSVILIGRCQGSLPSTFESLG